MDKEALMGDPYPGVAVGDEGAGQDVLEEETDDGEELARRGSRPVLPALVHLLGFDVLNLKQGVRASHST